MDYQKKMNSQREVVHPIVIWIIASILFHLLLALGIITLKISSLPLVTPKKETQDRAILMMDEPKKQKAQAQPAQSPAQPAPQQKKEAKKQEKEKEDPKLKWSDYTLIPGRQGINEQKFDDPKQLVNLPKPEEQKLAKKDQEKIKKQESTEEKIEQKKEALPESKPSELQDPKSSFSQPMPKKTTQPKPLTEFVDQEKKKSSIKEKLKKEFRTPIEEQDPYEFVPQPSKVISFQDLNLGFDNHYLTIGNNANLINQGITSAVPDAASLKHLTYYNQCAEMMKNEIRTHPQIRLCQNISGKNLVCAVTVDRQGRQLEFRMLQGSGNIILDRVIQESIMAVKMFPKVPSFIPDSPFVMRWRWYF